MLTSDQRIPDVVAEVIEDAAFKLGHLVETTRRFAHIFQESRGLRKFDWSKGEWSAATQRDEVRVYPNRPGLILRCGDVEHIDEEKFAQYLHAIMTGDLPDATPVLL